MRYMNEWDINEAVDRHRFDPVRGKAARFLAAFRDEVNGHSDGWPYWSPPLRAAAKLMALIEDNPNRPATEADLTRALAPIKGFYTRRGYAAGMRWLEVRDEDTRR